jgi:hypothetical protein
MRHEGRTSCRTRLTLNRARNKSFQSAYRDVGGVLATTGFGFVGTAVGTVLGAIVIRRMFD